MKVSFLICMFQELRGNRSGIGMMPIVLKTSAARMALASDAPQLAGTYHPQHPMLVGT
jgi:hypothetical protein